MRTDGGLLPEQKELREKKIRSRGKERKKKKEKKLTEQYITNVPQKRDSVCSKVSNV